MKNPVIEAVLEARREQRRDIERAYRLSQARLDEEIARLERILNRAAVSS